MRLYVIVLVRMRGDVIIQVRILVYFIVYSRIGVRDAGTGRQGGGPFMRGSRGARSALFELLRLFCFTSRGIVVNDRHWYLTETAD